MGSGSSVYPKGASWPFYFTILEQPRNCFCYRMLCWRQPTLSPSAHTVLHTPELNVMLVPSNRGTLLNSLRVRRSHTCRGRGGRRRGQTDRPTAAYNTNMLSRALLYGLGSGCVVLSSSLHSNPLATRTCTRTRNCLLLNGQCSPSCHSSPPPKTQITRPHIHAPTHHTPHC